MKDYYVEKAELLDELNTKNEITGALITMLDKLATRAVLDYNLLDKYLVYSEEIVNECIATSLNEIVLVDKIYEDNIFTIFAKLHLNVIKEFIKGI